MVGVAGDAGSHPDQHPLPRAALGREPLEPLEVVERVEHDVPDARLERLAQLLLGLGVAVQVDPGRVESRLQRERELPPEATSHASPSCASTR